jgi:hypothetical protein
MVENGSATLPFSCGLADCIGARVSAGAVGAHSISNELSQRVA